MRLVRPHCLATLCVPIGLLAISLAQPADAFAAFHRDRTPLSPSISGQTASHTSSSGGAAFARMLVGLVIVIAVILGVYYLLKIWGRRSKGVLRNDGTIQVLATTALAPNRSVHLIRVGSDVVLIGATDGGVTPIKVYEPNDLRELEAENFDSFTPAKPARAGTRISFMEALRQRTAR